MVVVRSLVAILLLTTAALAAEPPVRTVRVLPQTGFAPLFTRFTFAIEPHPDNRQWCYAFVEDGVDGPTILHCEQMEGDKSAKFYTREEKHVDEGEYSIQIVVSRAGGSVVRSTPVPLKVNPRFGD